MKRLLILLPLVVAACTGGPAATTAPTTAPVSSSAPSMSPTSAPTSAPTEAATEEPSEAPVPTETSSAAASPSEPADLVIGLDPTGAFLVTPEGFALYTFDPDNETMGDSACDEKCAEQWPPLEDPFLAEALGGDGVTGDFFSILRADGIQQVTYNDLPLYTYVGDEAPGDTNGDGLGGVWHLATPESCHTVIGCG